jgi:hypothetical protein
MFKLKFLVAAGAATLALGGASALAMQENVGGSGHPDNHGAVVSSAARTTCRDVTSGTRGACVSAIASTNGQAHRNGAGAQKVKDCKAQGLTGSDFGACVSGQPKHTPSGSSDHGAPEAPEAETGS